MPTRPAIVPVDTATTGWDAPVSQNFDNIFNGPFPVFRAIDFATLNSNYPADEFDDCIAVAQDTDVVYRSNGSSWIRLVPQMPYDGAPTATTLRDALVTAGLMAAS